MHKLIKIKQKNISNHREGQAIEEPYIFKNHQKNIIVRISYNYQILMLGKQIKNLIKNDHIPLFTNIICQLNISWPISNNLLSFGIIFIQLSSQFYSIYKSQKNSMIHKLILILCIALAVHSTSFTGLNLDPNLVTSTNNAMSNLRGLLTLYTCSGSQLFQNSNGGSGFNPQRYVLYSVIQTVINNLQSITCAVKANNIILGSGNIVQGKGNILIGNNDIVRGNNLWVFACSQIIDGSMLLIMGNFRIDLNRINTLMINPAAAIQCLNSNQVNDYFALFGVQASVPNGIISQVNQIKLLI